MFAFFDFGLEYSNSAGINAFTKTNKGGYRTAMIEVGSQVIYRKPKHSCKPGPRAAAITPSKHGDSYSYFVDKYWVVVECNPPDEIVVLTRSGKRLTLNADDPNLRRAGFLNRVFRRNRFPEFKAG